jgi:hypothetical protein
MIALAILGAVAVGSTSSSYARTTHSKATAANAAAVIHKQRYRGGYALQPGAAYLRAPLARAPWSQAPRNYPNPNLLPFLSWDPYGLRWDGAE